MNEIIIIGNLVEVGDDYIKVVENNVEHQVLCGKDMIKDLKIMPLNKSLKIKAKFGKNERIVALKVFLMVGED